MVSMHLSRALVDKRQLRTLGRIRTAGLNVRNVALCSAELRGSGYECERRDSNPLSEAQPGYSRPQLSYVGALARSGVRVPDRIRTGASRVTVGRSTAELQPPSLLCCVPAEGLEPPTVGV